MRRHVEVLAIVQQKTTKAVCSAGFSEAKTQSEAIHVLGGEGVPTEEVGIAKHASRVVVDESVSQCVRKLPDAKSVLSMQEVRHALQGASYRLCSLI